MITLLLALWMGAARAAEPPAGPASEPASGGGDEAAPPGDAAEPDPADPADPAPTDDGDDADATIVVTSTTPPPRVAGTAWRIDEAELDRYAYDDVHRVLAQVPGLYLRGEDGFGLRPNIGIRGVNSDRSARVTLLEDGVLLGPAPYAAPAAYYFPMPARMVGLDVYKGPAATRYGPQTVGGAIDLRTRPVPTTPGPFAMVDAALGRFTTARLDGVVGVGGPRAGLLAEATHLSSEGFKRLDGGGPTGFDRQDVMLKGRVEVPADRGAHTMELKLGYGRERSNETYLGLTREDYAADPRRRYAASALDLMRWQRSQAELAWRFHGAEVDVETVAYHHYLTRQWFKLNRFAGGPELHDILLAPPTGQAAVWQAILEGEADTTTPDQVLRIGTNDRRYHAFGVQSLVTWRRTAGKVRSVLEGGVRLHGDLVDRLHTEDPFAMTSGELVATGDPRITTLDTMSRALALAIHVHEDLGIGRLRLLPSLRVEVIHTAQADVGEVVEAGTLRATPLPGLGVMVQPAAGLELFASVHRGFSPVVPGQDRSVRPESSVAWELGARETWQGLTAEVVGFVNDYANLVGTCTFSAGCLDDALDRQFNGGKALVGGVEAVLGHTLTLPRRVTLSGQGTYTFTHATFRTSFDSSFPQFGAVDAGDFLPYVPMHTGGLRLAIDHPRISLSTSLQGRSGLRDVAGVGEVPDDDAIPGAVTVDVAATVPITDRIAVYGTVTNVANTMWLESWRPFGARPSAPLQGMVGLRVGQVGR